jgi:hypothetical protein
VAGRGTQAPGNTMRALEQCQFLFLGYHPFKKILLFFRFTEKKVVGDRFSLCVARMMA